MHGHLVYECWGLKPGLQGFDALYQPSYVPRPAFLAVPLAGIWERLHLRHCQDEDESGWAWKLSEAEGSSELGLVSSPDS